jgi:hypothetical protein
VAPVAALVCGGVLFFAGLGLGLGAAVGFRDALQRSAAGCGMAIGHGMAWTAVVAGVGSIVAAALAVVAEYRWRQRAARPVAVVVASVMAGGALFEVALNLFVVHEMDTCAALFG